MAGNVDLTASVHAPLVTRIREYGLDAQLVNHPLYGGDDDYVIRVTVGEAMVQITDEAGYLHFSAPAARWLAGLGDAPGVKAFPDPLWRFVYSGRDEDALMVALLTAFSRCVVCGTPEQVTAHHRPGPDNAVAAWSCPAHRAAVTEYVSA